MGEVRRQFQDPLHRLTGSYSVYGWRTGTRPSRRSDRLAGSDVCYSFFFKEVFGKNGPRLDSQQSSFNMTQGDPNPLLPDTPTGNPYPTPLGINGTNNQIRDVDLVSRVILEFFTICLPTFCWKRKFLPETRVSSLRLPLTFEDTVCSHLLINRKFTKNSVYFRRVETFHLSRDS